MLYSRAQVCLECLRRTLQGHNQQAVPFRSPQRHTGVTTGGSNVMCAITNVTVLGEMHGQIPVRGKGEAAENGVGKISSSVHNVDAQVFGVHTLRVPTLRLGVPE